MTKNTIATTVSQRPSLAIYEKSIV